MAPKRKASAKQDSEPKKAAKTKADAPPSEGGVVVVEACKSWGAFKTRANKVLKALEGKAEVKINEEKPRKGAFVVSVGDTKVVELLDMKRPFPALKALDMDDVAADVEKALAA